MSEITQELVKSLWCYDPEIGQLIWKVDRLPNKVKGKRAGSVESRGYRQVILCGRLMMEHRIIWLWMTGNDPGKLDIDHINHQRDDNRWCNLRLATRSENITNSKKGGISRGVYLTNNGNYLVYIAKNGVKYLSNYPTFEEAHAHRAKLEKELYGEFVCDRRETP